MITLLVTLASFQDIQWGSDSRPATIVTPFIGVNLRAKEMPVRRALAEIGKQMGGERFDVAKEIQGNVNASFINLPYNLAIDRIATQVGAQNLTLTAPKMDPKKAGTMTPVIRKITALPTYQEKVNLDLKDANIRDGLRTLFRQTDHSYTIAVELNGITSVKAINEPLLPAVAKLLAPVRGRFIIEGGVFCFFSGANPIYDQTLQTGSSDFIATKERRLDALSRFAKRAMISVELEGNVALGDRFTATIEKKNMAETLTTILGPKNVYRIENGILIVTPKA